MTYPSIRADTVAVINHLDGMKAKVTRHNTTVKRIATNVFRRYSPVFLDQLRQAPPPVKYPIQWTTEKQRRAFFATDGFGRGIPTRRTGAMQRGITQQLDIGPERIQVITRSRRRYSRYVIGRPVTRGRDQVQAFHLNTGWKRIAPMLDEQAIDWFNAFQDEYEVWWQTR